MNKILHYTIVAVALTALSCNQSPPAPPPLPESAPTVTDKNSSIEGDFDGDGKQEALRLRITDERGTVLSKEAVQARLAENMSWVGEGELVCTNPLVPELVVGGGCIGLVSLINEGDLDGDGAEEISLVKDWATSLIRDMEVYSLRKDAWALRTAFMINIGMLESEGLDFDRLLTAGSRKGEIIRYEYDGIDPDTLWRKQVIMLDKSGI